MEITELKDITTIILNITLIIGFVVLLTYIILVLHKLNNVFSRANSIKQKVEHTTNIDYEELSNALTEYIKSGIAYSVARFSLKAVAKFSRKAIK